MLWGVGCSANGLRSSRERRGSCTTLQAPGLGAPWPPCRPSSPSSPCLHRCPQLGRLAAGEGQSLRLRDQLSPCPSVQSRLSPASALHGPTSTSLAPGCTSAGHWILPWELDRLQGQALDPKGNHLLKLP